MTTAKARVNNDGVANTLIQHQWRPSLIVVCQTLGILQFPQRIIQKLILAWHIRCFICGCSPRRIISVFRKVITVDIHVFFCLHALFSPSIIWSTQVYHHIFLSTLRFIYISFWLLSLYLFIKFSIVNWCKNQIKDIHYNREDLN